MVTPWWHHVQQCSLLDVRCHRNLFSKSQTQEDTLMFVMRWCSWLAKYISQKLAHQSWQPPDTCTPEVSSGKSTKVQEDKQKGEDLKCLRVQLLSGVVLIDRKRHNLPINKEDILKEYHIFSGIGALPADEYHITLKKDYVPVQHLHRLLPGKFKSPYKEELQWLCIEGIIVPVQEHTEWTNAIVMVGKADLSLRLCLDSEDLNKNIERNLYHTRTIDDLSAELHRLKYFILMDAKLGCWIGWKHRESSLLMIFNTSWESTDDYDYLLVCQSGQKSSRRDWMQ